MKKFIFIMMVLIAGTTLAQTNIPADHYSELSSGYNYSNNPTVREYMKTGKLPRGWYPTTVRQLNRKMKATALWVKFKIASWHNRQVAGGIFMDPDEVMLVDDKGNLVDAVTCGNYVAEYKFIYDDTCIPCCYEEEEVIVNVNFTSKTHTGATAGTTSTSSNYNYTVTYD